MGEQLNCSRENSDLSSPLDALWNPTCQIPCLIVYSQATQTSQIEYVLNPLRAVLSERGFNVNETSEESILQGQVAESALNPALAILIHIGKEPALQYSYGFLKGKGKFVLKIRDLSGAMGGKGADSLQSAKSEQGNKQIGELNEILVDSLAHGSSQESIGKIINTELGSFIPQALDSYVTELVKVYSTTGEGLISESRDLTSELLSFYTNTQQYGLKDLYRLDEALSALEEKSGVEPNFLFITILSELFRGLAETEKEFSTKDKAFIKAATLLKIITTEVKDEELAQCINIKRAEALSLVSNNELRIDTLEQAVELLSQALSYFSKEQNEHICAYLNNRMGEFSLERSLIENQEDRKIELVREALQHIEKSLTFYSSSEYEQENLNLIKLLNRSLTSVLETEIRGSELDSVINKFGDSLRFIGAEGSKELFSESHINLGDAYCRRAQINSSSEDCILAIEAYERALRSSGSWESGQISAETLVKLGFSHDMLAQLDESVESGQLAVESFEEALNYFSLSEHPDEYGSVQNSLANAYFTLAELSDLESNSQKAAACLIQALKVITIDNDPLKYGKLQNNLGFTYSVLSEIKNKKENLQNALVAYTEALKVYDSDTYPSERAMISVNLGDTYHLISEFKDKSLNLKKAEVAYNSALSADTEYLENPVIQKKLGDVLFELSALQEGSEYEERSITSYEVSLNYYTKQEHQIQFGLIMANMGSLWSRAALREHNNELFEKTLSAYGEALAIFTEDQYPERYYELKSLSGDAYKGLADITANNDYFDKAIKEYEDALLVLGKLDSKVSASNIHNKIGLCYAGLWVLTESIEQSEKAAHAFSEATRALGSDYEPYVYGVISSNLGASYSRLSEAHGASEYKEPATLALEKAVTSLKSEAAQGAIATLPYVKSLGNLGALYNGTKDSSFPKEILVKSIELLDEALTQLDPEASPGEYARINNNLGNSYFKLAALEDGKENYSLAIDSYKKASGGYSNSPSLQSIIANNNLGKAYLSYAEYGDNIKSLEKALLSFKDALLIAEELEKPVRRAEIILNIALTYTKTAAYKNSAQNYEHSAASYEDALSFYTIESYPEEHIDIKKNIGLVLMLSCCAEESNEGCAALSERALKYLEEASSSIRSDHSGRYGYVLAAMGDAHMFISSVKENHENSAKECYSKALECFTVDTHPEQYLELMQRLEPLYDQEAENGLIEPLSLIEFYNKALQIYKFDTYPYEYAALNKKLAHAYLSLGKDDPKFSDRQDELSSLEEALRGYTVMGEEKECGFLQKQIGDLHMELAQRDNAPEEYRAAIKRYDEALRVHTAKEHPELYGEIKKCLGTAYGALAGAQEGDENYLREIDSYSKALGVFTRDEYYDEYRELRKRMGGVYTMLAGAKAELEDYDGALEQYEEALKVFTFEDFPEEYGKYKYELAKILDSSGRSSGDINLVHDALGAYRETTRYYTESEYPEDYAKIENDIKGLYKFLSEYDAGSGESAKSVYEKLLQICTESEAPYEHALLQMKLGDSYLGQPEPGSTEPDARSATVGSLESSVHSYQNALRIYNGEEFQKERACIEFRLAASYRALAGLLNEEENLAKSMEYYNSSITYYTYENFPQANKRASEEISGIYKRLSELESDRRNPAGSLNYLEKVLNLSLQDESAEEIAEIKKKLAGLYLELSDGDEKVPNFEKALGYYEQALEYYSSETHPEIFGDLTKTLAALYFEIAQGAQDPGIYEKSFKYAQRALSHFTPDTNPEVCAELHNIVGDACGALHSVDNDIELLKKRVSSYAEFQRINSSLEGGLDTDEISIKLASAYRELGEELKARGELKEAASNYSLALKQYGGDEISKRAPITFELGALYESLSKTEETVVNARLAQDYYKQARELYIKTGDEEKAKESIDKTGAIYAQLAEYACDSDRTEEELKELLEICTKDDAPMQYAGISKSLGNIYRELLSAGGGAEAANSAFAAYGEAEKIFLSLDHDRESNEIMIERALLINIISDGKLDEGEYEDALKGYRQALDIYDSLELRQEYSETERRLGAVYIKRGEAFEQTARLRSDEEALKKAVGEYTDALGIFSEARSPEEFGMLHTKLSALYLLMGEREASMEHYNKTIGACREALRVFGPEDYPERHMEIQNYIVRAYEAITELKDKQAKEQKAKAEASVVQLTDEKPVLQVVKSEKLKEPEDEVEPDEPEKEESEQVPQAVMAKASSGDSGVDAFFDEPEFSDSSQAIDYYTKALATTTIETSPEQYGWIKSKLGGLYNEVARTTGSASSFRRAVKSYEDSLKVYNSEQYPEKFGEVQKRIGESMMLLAEQSGDNKSYRRALSAYEDALNVFNLENHPDAFGKLQMNIGRTYVTLAEMSSNADEYGNAISAYEKALLVFNAKEHSEQYGEANRNIGIAYGILAEIDGNTEYHQKAVHAYEEALKYYGAQNAPSEHGEISKYLGMAYRNVASESGDEAVLKLSIESYKEALDYYTEEESLNDYGLIQKNLGGAYEKLSLKEPDSESAKLAVASFAQALKYYKPGNMPLDYASINSSLGGLFKAVSEREDKVGNLRRAIRSYEEVLKVFNIKEFPVEYAATENNIGIVYRSLAEAENKGKNCKRAVNSYKEALKIYSRSSYPDQYGSTQTNLGSAYRTLAEVEDKEVNCKHALRAFEEALKVRTIKEQPLQFAATQNNLGVVYRTLGEKEDRARNSNKAINAYETALIIYTIDKYPIQYASTQNNIGAAYTTLAEVENKDENCDKAIDAYTEALKIFTEDRFPGPHSLVSKNLELLKKYCGKECQDS